MTVALLLLADLKPNCGHLFFLLLHLEGDRVARLKPIRNLELSWTRPKLRLDYQEDCVGIVHQNCVAYMQEFFAVVPRGVGRRLDRSDEGIFKGVDCDYDFIIYNCARRKLNLIQATVALVQMLTVFGLNFALEAVHSGSSHDFATLIPIVWACPVLQGLRCIRGV